MTHALAVFVGVFAWTLLEYLLHRFAFHHRRSWRWMRRDHLQHHAAPDTFAPAMKKVAVAVPVLGGLALLAAPLVGAPHGGLFAAGVALGWTLYEALHRRVHVAAPSRLPGLGAYGRWARRHHLHHHFVDPAVNHGVSTDLWDRAFGTKVVPGRIDVPRRHVRAFPWLLDGDEIATAYQGQYRLR